MAYIHPRDIKTTEYINQLLEEMPNYIKDYYSFKDRNYTSPNTLLQYLYIYRDFLTWLITDAHVNVGKISEITVTHLDELAPSIAQTYMDKVRNGKKKIDEENNTKFYTKRSVNTVANILSALKSLFRFLSKLSVVDDTHDTYLKNDIFAKIPVPTVRETAQSRAERISDDLIPGEKFTTLLEYMEFEYPKTLTSNQNLARFQRDIKRDLTIISMLLTTGIRVSECANMILSDINFVKRTSKVTRKGNSLDTIFILDSTYEKLEDYLAIRNLNYTGADNCPYLFVSLYGGEAKPLTVKAIENIVKKYTAAFSGGKGVSPHKLRHSFAVDFRNRGGLLEDLRDLMGHKTTDTTSLYTNNSNELKYNFLREIDDDRRKSPL